MFSDAQIKPLMDGNLLLFVPQNEFTDLGTGPIVGIELLTELPVKGKDKFITGLLDQMGRNA